MIPILYPETEKSFDTNGIGILRDAIDCTAIGENPGLAELELQYPVAGIHFSDIVDRAIILAEPDPVSDPQPYRIYRITKPSNGIVTVYARHIAYDLAGIPVSPFSASTAPLALQGLKTNAVEECPFEFWTDMTTEGDMAVNVPTAIWSLLGSDKGAVLNVYGGEYEFDRFTVKLHGHRGADRGVSIRYGKNLTSLEQDSNCANCYTGVYPYWTGSDGTLVQLPEKTIKAEGNFTYTRTLTLDLSSEFSEKPTEEQLRERAKKYMTDNDIGTPVVSWKVEFVQLEQTEEYKGMALLERVLLGDTVHVEFPKLDVSASARAVSVRYKPILQRYESITLGSVKANIAQTIASQQKQINSLPGMTAMQQAAAALTAIILGAKGGAVRLLDTDGDGQNDTLYIADNADPALAVKVWRFNYEGWAASKNGYNGPFVLGATLDGGMLADFITAGTLNANLVKIINLIADHLLSVDGGSELEINGSQIAFRSNGVRTMLIHNYSDGQVRIMMDANDEFGEYCAIYAPGFLSFSGSDDLNLWNAGIMRRMSDSQGSFLIIEEIRQPQDTSLPFKFLGKTVSWQSNGDGTFTLIGQ